MTTFGTNNSNDKQLYWVADNVTANDFPPVTTALREPDGLLAIGGDLSAERLLKAYRHGIFPWYSKGQPILWWSPNPRCILELDELKISRSLAKTIRKGEYHVHFNTAFEKVIQACAAPRQDAEETWLTREMQHAYHNLHKSGQAISVESWYENTLVGGLYGLVIGRIFFGESMFSLMSDASKVALVKLVEKLKQQQFRLIDCQVHSPHLQRLGAKPIHRELFINTLKQYCEPAIQYTWS